MAVDLKVVKKLKRRDEDAFKQVYYEFYKQVYYEAYLILKNKEDAEDVMQTVFIKLMKNVEDLEDDTNIKALLVRMSKNEAIDTYRRNARKYEVHNDELLEAIPDQQKDTFDVVMTLHNALSEYDANILVKKIVYDYTFQEIADELHESLNKIQGIYYRGIETLKKYYEKGK